MPERIDSKFRYVLLSAVRAEQMIRGAAPKIEPGKRRLTRIAMEEILTNAVDWDYGPAPEAEPLEGDQLADGAGDASGDES